MNPIRIGRGEPDIREFGATRTDSRCIAERKSFWQNALSRRLSEAVHMSYGNGKIKATRACKANTRGDGTVTYLLCSRTGKHASYHSDIILRAYPGQLITISESTSISTSPIFDISVPHFNDPTFLYFSREQDKIWNIDVSNLYSLSRLYLVNRCAMHERNVSYR